MVEVKGKRYDKRPTDSMSCRGCDVLTNDDLECDEFPSCFGDTPAERFNWVAVPDTVKVVK